MDIELYRILVELYDEVKDTLKDPFINSYTEFKYRRYEKLCNFLLDKYK